MRLTSGDPDLFDRFDVQVDQDADPVDIDEAVADFLLRFLETTLADSPVATVENRSGADER